VLTPDEQNRYLLQISEEEIILLKLDQKIDRPKNRIDFRYPKVYTSAKFHEHSYVIGLSNFVNRQTNKQTNQQA